MKKTIETGEYDSLFHVNGGGQKGKLVNIEMEIINEINKNNYHSQQQGRIYDSSQPIWFMKNMA